MVRVNLAIERFIKPQFLLEVAYKVSAGRVGVKSCGHAVLADTLLTELKTFLIIAKIFLLQCTHTHTHMYYTCFTCNYIIIVNNHIKVFPSATCTKWLLTNKLHVCMMTKSYSRLEFRNRPSILYVI